MIFETQRGQAIPTLMQVEGERRKLDQRAHRRNALLTFLLSPEKTWLCSKPYLMKV